MIDRDDTPQLEAAGLAEPIRRSFFTTWPNAMINWMVVHRRANQPSVGINFTVGPSTDTVVLHMSDGGLQVCFKEPLTDAQLAVLEELADRTD